MIILANIDRIPAWSQKLCIWSYNIRPLIQVNFYTNFYANYVAMYVLISCCNVYELQKKTKIFLGGKFFHSPVFNIKELV